MLHSLKSASFFAENRVHFFARCDYGVAAAMSPAVS